MQNELILERIENLRGRKPYEEKKAAKLGFASLYEYFEDKIAKESKAWEADQANKIRLKKSIKTKVSHNKDITIKGLIKISKLIK